jgi:hypothetical protein
MYPQFILIFAIILAVIIAVPIFSGGLGKKSKSKKSQFAGATTIDKKFVQEKWQEIESIISSGGASQLKVGIMEADKLVDYVLKCRGISGNNMGERMKSAKTKFSDYSDYNNLWFAHKVRNNVAHESSHELGSAEAKRAVEYFKKALKILGAL